MKRFLAATLFTLAFAATPARPQTQPARDTDIRDEAPVVVQGVLPGPRLWKVGNGDHVMWVLGTLSPLPKRMQWRSAEVEAALAASQEILYPPRLQMTVDAGGFFRGVFLLPKLYGARKNPDGKTLADVLPDALYARWVPLRQRYLGRGRGAEAKRPIFAAEELWEEALDDNDLVRGGIVGPVLERAVKAHGLRETTPSRKVTVTDPKAMLAEAEHLQLDDLGCMEATIEALEAGPARLRLRANAWATGDLETLRALPEPGHGKACTHAAIDSPLLRKRGTDGITDALEQDWLAAAEKALAENASTFALLPISDLLSEDGYLAKLQSRGYEVTPPN